ncbi:GNAT family N-acetyltransferase [Natrialba taiwanensis]|uniref:N-acetyltransferase GCN5 n=1 Tax=Natrialba taiwanensis DSM 12281 TaxID=1230458 RepID=M0A7M3_9EURY|nr:GNAT family N-acetyltransferase [Natrialba taiwanensis]ELY94514.1 N-acetyltransferase GCN5 [Natrialba taiwanensis DSM 12281]
MDWIARQATPTAAPTVREIARESWHAAYDEFLGSAQVERMIDEWYALDELEESIATASDRDDELFVLAVPAGDTRESDRETADAVGFAHAGSHPDEPTVASLARLYARPPVWGEGIGTVLLERVEADLRATCERLRLTVLADNDIGVSFYESRGFDRVATQVSDLDGADGTGELEEFIYEKRL